MSESPSMMFTRSAARALLINRVTRHNNNLPEDVLLEIFDTYRQLHELQPNYETVWNSRDGWFKLAHVCLHWRRVVFLSPSYLHVHLLFTPCRSSRDPILRALPRFPILFDYRTASQNTEKEDKFSLAAIGQRTRVRGIAFRMPCSPRLLEALSHPFPKLESVKIESYFMNYYPSGTKVLVAFLSSSAPSLRRLTLHKFTLEDVFPLLSSATGIEELVLMLSVPYGTHPATEALLVAILRRISCLRYLELKLKSESYIPVITLFPNPPPASADSEDVVPLSRLTDFIFVGDGTYLQILTTKLAAPSLQRLDVNLIGGPTFPLPQLCKFICDSNCQFKVVRLDLSHLFHIKLYAETCSKSNHAQPAFRITIPAKIPVPIPWEQIGQMLSGPLSTVEVLVIGCELSKVITHKNINWHALFIHIPQIKFLQVHHQAALGVARAFRLGGQEPALDFLPSLEQVEVQFSPSMAEFYRKFEYAHIFSAFGPFIASRKRVGHPINLSRT